MPIHHIDLDRRVTRQEVAVLRWLLDKTPVGDVAEYRNQRLEDLHVVGMCDCGCESVYFESGAGRYVMIADSFGKYPDGLPVNLILWGRAGRIAWLEISGPGPNSRLRLPAVNELRSWEQMFDD